MNKTARKVIMIKQDEFNDLMDLIHRHYSAEEIEEYKGERYKWQSI